MSEPGAAEAQNAAAVAAPVKQSEGTSAAAPASAPSKAKAIAAVTATTAASLSSLRLGGISREMEDEETLIECPPVGAPRKHEFKIGCGCCTPGMVGLKGKMGPMI